jgi:hypothetical protein
VTVSDELLNVKPSAEIGVTPRFAVVVVNMEGRVKEKLYGLAAVRLNAYTEPAFATEATQNNATAIAHFRMS